VAASPYNVGVNPSVVGRANLEGERFNVVASRLTLGHAMHPLYRTLALKLFPRSFYSALARAKAIGLELALCQLKISPGAAASK
jgi:hypothetical protein